MAGCPKSALITGASRGIGLEFARQLANSADGPEILLAACRTPDSAAELKKVAGASKKAKVHLIKLDVCDDASIKSAISEAEKILGDKGLTLLINNAGVLEMDALGSGMTTRDQLIKHFNINTCGPIITSQEFLPLLKKAAQKNADQPFGIGKSAVINISTGAASLGDNKGGGVVAYRCSKAAMNMGTLCLSIALKNDGIMCVNILPGFVKTDMTGGKGNMTVEESVGSMISSIRKFGEAENGGFYNYRGEKFPW